MTAMFSRFSTALASTVLIGAGALAASTPASADGAVCSHNDGCAAEATFQSYGEHFTVHDYAPDGHSAVGLLEYWNGSTNSPYSWVWNSNGYSGSPVTVNYSIPEGRKVRYEACIGDSDAGTGTITDCSDWRYDTA
jgi:hypothetical protein